MMNRRERIIAWTIGTGLVISVIHQPKQPLIDLAFLPHIGNLMIIMASAVYLLGLKKGEIDLGSKWLWIPLVVIVLSMIARPFYALVTWDSAWGMKVEWAGAAYGMALFALYLASRKLGTEIFKPFIAGVIIASVSCVAFGVINLGVKTGGIVSVSNYDMATGLLVFGVIVSSLQSRWWLSAIAIVGLFFTGADEAIFAVVVLVLVVLVKRDWSRKLLLPVGALALTLIVCTSLGITQQLYFPTAQKVAAVKEVVEETEVGKIIDKVVPDIITDRIETYKPKIANDGSISEADLWLDKATSNRWLTYWKLPEVKPLGYGYNINSFYPGIIHNVPLIIVHQIGIVGAVAWAFATGYLLFRTRWKYAWIGVLSLCVFDHFIWTQAAPWFWVLAGVSSAGNIKADYIFKEVK